MSSSGLKISIIGLRGFPSDYSGLERLAEELFPGLVSNGHELTVFSRDKKSAFQLTKSPGISIVNTYYLNISSVETVSHAFFSFMYAVLNRKKTDVIFLQSLAPSYLSYFCWAFNIPCVVAVHGLDWGRAKWKGVGSLILKLSEKLTVRYATEIIVVSKELQAYYHHKYQRHTYLIPNAIDFSRQNEKDGSAVVPQPEVHKQGYILCCSRLVPEKRIEDVICAFKSSGNNCKLVIVGTGPKKYRKHLMDMAGGDSRIMFTGHQGRMNTREWIRHALVVISASELEGMPLALIEAIAMGIPVIASDINPHRELLESVNNLFFDLKDIIGLKRKIDDVLANYDHYKQEAEALKKRSSFQDVESMIRRTESILAIAKNKISISRYEKKNG